MTREELKNIVRHVFHFYDVNVENSNWTDMNEACGEILKLLEQEHSEDTISRQVVITKIHELWNSTGDKDYCMETLRDFVSELSTVTEQPKWGRWIIVDDCEKFIAKCSECGQIEDSRRISKYSYCPNCGTKMG